VSDSYYGRPIVKPHVWQWYIPAYFWIGGMAGASSVLSLVARANGRHAVARISNIAAFSGIVVAPVLLTADLGRPLRSLNMLRVFKVTSPMSVGTWLLIGFSGAVTLATSADLFGPRPLAVAAEVGAAALGAPFAVYTAVLIADTATPIWHEAHDTLPFVFVASGLAGAGAVATAFAGPDDRALPRRAMLAGGVALLAGSEIMEKRLGTFLAEPYHKGEAGRLHELATLSGIVGLAFGLIAGTNASLNRIAAAGIAAAGILERFAIMAAGTESANDPKYVVVPQRERIAAREAAAAAATTTA